jgi:hypothetical protein
VNVNPPDGISKKTFEEDKMIFVEQTSPKIGHDFGELKTEISRTASRIAYRKDEFAILYSEKQSLVYNINWLFSSYLQLFHSCGTIRKNRESRS